MCSTSSYHLSSINEDRRGQWSFPSPPVAQDGCKLPSFLVHDVFGLCVTGSPYIYHLNPHYSEGDVISLVTMFPFSYERHLAILFLLLHTAKGTYWSHAVARRFNFNAASPRATSTTWTMCAIHCHKTADCIMFLLDQQGDCYFKTVLKGQFGVDTFGSGSSHPVFMAAEKLQPSWKSALTRVGQFTELILLPIGPIALIQVRDPAIYPLAPDSSLQVEICFMEHSGPRCCKTDPVNDLTTALIQFHLPKGRWDVQD